jgi:hypothetical protein
MRKQHFAPFLISTAIACSGGGFNEGPSSTPETPPDAPGATHDSGSLSFPFVPTNVSPAGAFGGDLDLTGAGPLGCSDRIRFNTDTGDVRCPNVTLNVVFWAADQIGVPSQSPKPPKVEVFAVYNFHLAAGMEMFVVGSRPFVLLALGDVLIEGHVFVNGVGYSPGPGGFGAGQGPGDGTSIPTNTVGGGGGASFCSGGGRGGLGQTMVGGLAGPLYGNASISPLLGGSSGGSTEDSAGGVGGGAIQISAGASITIAAGAFVHAGGSEGQPGCLNGGGGGGSGGAILLEAPSVSIAGSLAANGGAGEPGSCSGNPVGNPSSSSSPDDKPMVDPIGQGGSGAAGSATATDGKTPIRFDQVGPGGGGGGAGWIRINTTAGKAEIKPGAIVSPSLDSSCATFGKVHS